jgi:hypothetical protein
MRRVPIAALAASLTWLAPLYAYACPMCFSVDKNTSAYVYGSLFLMIVPVSAIGSLVYLAYRRIRAHEEAENPRAALVPEAPHVAATPGLRVIDRS